MHCIGFLLTINISFLTFKIFQKVANRLENLWKNLVISLKIVKNTSMMVIYNFLLQDQRIIECIFNYSLFPIACGLLSMSKSFGISASNNKVILFQKC